MQTMVRSRFARALALLMACGVALPYLGSAACAAKEAQPLTRTMLVFPFDNGAGSDADRVADELTAYVRGGLAASGGYHVISYSDRLPAVQRMALLNPEKVKITKGPFYANRTAVNNAVALARETDADILVVGSVDNYSVSDAGVAELVATVELMDALSGKSVRVLSVTGRTDAGSAADGAAKLADKAIQVAGDKIIFELIGQQVQVQNPSTTPEPPVQPKKNKKKSWVTALLVAVGIGLIAGSGGGGGSSSTDSGENPPPPPVDL